MYIHETYRIRIGQNGGMTNFSKTAERNKTLFTGIQVRLKLSSNQQTDQKLVHSTRRHSNIKVSYQMTKSPKYGSCFAKIRHLDYIKLHTKYIWGESPLRQQTKFHGEVQHEVTIQSLRVYPVQVPCFTGSKLGHLSWPIYQKRLIETERDLYQSKAQLKLGITSKFHQNRLS